MVERALRLVGATGAATFLAYILYSSAHPCDPGLGPALGVPFGTAAIVYASAFRRLKPSVILVDGLAVATVFALGGYIWGSTSGFIAPSGEQCDPVPIGGFVQMGILSLAGMQIPLGTWLGRRLNERASR